MSERFQELLGFVMMPLLAMADEESLEDKNLR